jgi:hypothetical protein
MHNRPPIEVAEALLNSIGSRLRFPTPNTLGPWEALAYWLVTVALVALYIAVLWLKFKLIVAMIEDGNATSSSNSSNAVSFPDIKMADVASCLHIIDAPPEPINATSTNDIKIPDTMQPNKLPFPGNYVDGKFEVNYESL